MDKTIIIRIGKVVKVQKFDGNWNYDPYMFGLLNGMIMIEAMVKGKTPDFYEKPKRWKRERWYERIINKITGKRKPVKAKS